MFHLLHLKNHPILQLLQLEEALLRQDDRNWCIINEGSPPAIVMGISGKPDELIDLAKWKQAPIPVIKRFSGGGTVVVDFQTIFITFICRKDLHPFPAYPESILKWSETIYQTAHPTIQLRENDFVIGEKKCGGNAQYIRKDRWLQHTSFLWDFNPALMDLLLLPKRTPDYRQNRSHGQFLLPLNQQFPDKALWISTFKQQLEKKYDLETIDLPTASDILKRPHRQSTTVFSNLQKTTEILL
jgi:lipoate---protein ligase